MERLGNIIKYLKNSDYNERTLKDDINYFFDNHKQLEFFYPEIMDEVKTLIVDRINTYRYKMDIYLRAYLNNEFDHITKTYIQVKGYPLYSENFPDMDEYIFRRIFKSEDSIYLSIDLVNTEKVFNKKLIDTKCTITDRDALHDYLDEVYCLTDAEVYHYYRNKDKEFYTDEEYDEMYHEIQFRDTCYRNGIITSRKFTDKDYIELVGEYGEYKVKKYFEDYHLNGNYTVEQVSKYGNGFGYDIALVRNDFMHVQGLEVKSTFQEYDYGECDVFQVSDNEISNFMDENNEPSKNFFVVRYSIKEDKLYMIGRNNNGYYCIDQDGNEHKIKTIGNLFQLTRIQPRKKGK